MTQKTERLVNLTIALLETRIPLSLLQIQQKTGYYTAADHDAARRMFERDKDDLRSMGVPVETALIPYSDDTGYIIHRKQYEQADPSFTRDEMTALALAQQYAQSADVGLAFAKIAARAPDPDSSALALNFPVRVTESLYPPDNLTTAVVEHVTVRFQYQTPRTGSSSRTVDPYALARRRGRWYLVGFDHQPAAVRAFRLDRIDGEILSASAPGAFSPPDGLDVASELIPPTEELFTVTGEILASFAEQIVQRGGEVAADSNGWCAFTLPDVDEVRDVPWLLAFGSAVRIDSPPAIVHAVCDALDTVVAAHGGEA